MTIAEGTKAAANPTKAFFVKMITRDITLEDCILDLIDNSVDGAWRSEGSRPMGLGEETDLSKYSISITTSRERFCIEDNCGGMTLDDAINHAFSFGRPDAMESEDYSIGVYGIGMKRAVFKLGTEIRIRSTYTRKEDNERESFTVPINVSNWLANDAPPWDFDIVTDEHLEENGVKIDVDGLTVGASTSFGNPAFLQNLRRTIARDYSIHLNRGLKITLNDDAIVGWQIELRQSADFLPVRVEWEEEIAAETITEPEATTHEENVAAEEREIKADKVSIEIIGGMAAPPPENSDPDEQDDSDKRYGWYVVCNGRIVLAADKTTISGWGVDDWPSWHRQYSGFIGIILFTAANAAALPLTTTKRSVDTSSEIYRRARPRMREVTRAWINYTNARKQALEEAKRKESEAQAVSIYQVNRQAAVRLPTFTARPTERVANVLYTVPVSRLRKLAREFGSVNMPYREVGLKSFEYAYEDKVGEE